MKKYLLFFLFISAFCFFGKSQVLINSTPEEAGMSPARLELLDNFISNYVNQKAVPGGTFLVARKGKIVYYKSFGNQSIGSSEPYHNNNIFRLASMTKAVTTVAVMQLYEQGKLGLEDPIFYYIPGFKEMAVLDTFDPADSTYTTIPSTTPITIRHLLTHTSGIAYGDFNPGKIQAVYEQFDMNNVGIYHPKWTTKEFIDRLAEVPLAFEPGSRFLYGLNMDVLGRIIEVASGIELNEYFEKNIFEPLGMTDTYFNLPTDKQDRLVPVYTYDKEGHFTMAKKSGLARNPDFPNLPDHHFYAGGGGLSGSVIDYARLIQSLVNDGRYNGHRILSRKTIEIITSDQLIKQNSLGTGVSKIPGITFGLGFLLYTDDAEGLNSKSVGTYEWGGYFNTKFFIDPKEELIFVGMTQVVPFQRPDFWERMYSIIYAAIEE